MDFGVSKSIKRRNQEKGSTEVDEVSDEVFETPVVKADIEQIALYCMIQCARLQKAAVNALDGALDLLFGNERSLGNRAAHIVLVTM